MQRARTGGPWASCFLNWWQAVIYSQVSDLTFDLFNHSYFFAFQNRYKNCYIFLIGEKRTFHFCAENFMLIM